MAEEDFHIRQVISNLTDSLEELESRTNTLESSIPQKIEYLINQNPDGSWSREKIVSEISQTPLQIKNKELEKSKELTNNYREIAKSYDKIVSDYNTQINQKKQEILSIFTTAINGGCDIDDYSTDSSPLIIDGVSVGLGSTIYNDKLTISRYLNIENFGVDNLFESSSEELEENLFGYGYKTISQQNSGSLVGNFTNLTSPSVGDCVGYANSIITLSSEIQSLRLERDTQISAVNTVKSSLSDQQFLEWSTNSINDITEESNTLKTAISNFNNITENITLDNLFFYIDASREYSINISLDTKTGINNIVGIENLGTDGTNLIISDTNPTFDNAQELGTVWFNQYNYNTKFLESRKNYVGNESKIAIGDTSFSMESWIYLTADTGLSSDIDTGGASIVGIASTSGYGMQVYKSGDDVKVNFGSRGDESLDSSKIDLNTWYHIVSIKEQGKGSSIYINGSLDTNDVNDILSVSSTDKPLRIGFSTSTYIQNVFPGKISLVRLYSKALTELEVQKNFNASKVRYGYT